ncbi:hypothetical protein FC82_GL001471 [Secundilactobacillus collinoides DSM 20515 = JCM 1123]|uniref:Uncharacterized protein n=2 Tax=Secundilactobacillus collinoides TaxID=33960 RepID=A0A0R2B209_SECCO|nr:hypothetical protein FC82_GL001471 [Secundilactobacillus collinoides DSM 20515 = JCM 1123]
MIASPNFTLGASFILYVPFSVVCFVEFRFLRDVVTFAEQPFVAGKTVEMCAGFLAVLLRIVLLF